MWEAWKLDWQTWGWIGFIVYFAVWEWVTRDGQQLTDHLRPLFHAAPPLWFLAFGLWAWIGVHFLFPSLEQWLLRNARSR